jgi:hypothetical protein
VLAGQVVPPDLITKLRKYPTPPETDKAINEASKELKDLYITDFEMARLKEVKESRLLQIYLKMETYVPSEFMFVAEKGLIIIVPTPNHTFDHSDHSLLLHLGIPG